MKVLKFGGTSVGSPQRMKSVAGILSGLREKKIVVLSAVSGTTNKLVEISRLCGATDKAGAKKEIEALKESYRKFVADLFEDERYAADSQAFVDQIFEDIQCLADQQYSQQVDKMLVIQGELISTRFFTNYLKEQGVDVTLLMAQDFMTLDANNEPDLPTIKKKIKNLLDKTSSEVIVTQGFITRNASGGLDNLQRGGSDYSATIIGAVIDAEEVQIWTDIDGMHNNDPRVVNNTFSLPRLSFEEASELAYFGAKVLHPYCIVPAQQYGVPVRIKNTMDPTAEGTLISDESEPQAIKAIAAKDGITAIKIKSSRMVMAYGFLRRIFEIFEKYKTPIDMITTSEIAISLTIDNPESLDEIVTEISKYGKVEVDKEQTIICIVGDLIAERKGVGKEIFRNIEDIPIRMISYGGSRNNISILIDSRYKKDALIKLNALFTI